MINKFLRTVILFMLPLFVFFAVSEILYKQIPNDYSYKSDYLQIHGASIKILAIGSSHAYRGIDPSCFSRDCFNAAMVSQSIDYDYFILENNIQALKNLEFVLLPISYFSLTRTLDESIESWRRFNYHHYAGIQLPDPKDRFNIKAISPMSVNGYEKSFKRLSNYLHKSKDLRKCNDLGWAQWPNRKKVDFEEAAAKAAIRHEDHEYDFSENIKLIENMYELCERQNAKLILYIPPYTKTYMNKLDAKKWEKILSTCNELALKHSDIFFVDYSENNDFQTVMFGDADHLNIEGAKLLSTKLNKYLLEL